MDSAFDSLLDSQAVIHYKQNGSDIIAPDSNKKSCLG